MSEVNPSNHVDVKLRHIVVHDFIPKQWTVWRHRNGNEYIVYDVTNETSDKHEKYPVSISYYNPRSHTRFSRKARDWTFGGDPVTSFEFVRELDASEIEALKKVLL